MSTELRNVYLPLEKLDKCVQCAATNNLRLCSSCGERIYCSEACQKADWRSHKANCGQTDRIELAHFYPFLACLAEASRIHIEKPMHPAMTHEIINAPNPGAPSTRLPDGTVARLVMLGPEIPLTAVGSPVWWPAAASDKVRSKLLRRILREGFALPICLAICVALLAEVYTTTYVAPTAGSPARRRVRLRYGRTPIADFGIARGAADVKGQDRLAYLNVVDGTFQMGQDPDDHYWIYFTTAAGEELVLDVAMFTFNMCMMVPVAPYIPPPPGGQVPFSFAPAFFRDRMLARGAPVLQSARTRTSVLRDAGLQTAVQTSRSYFRSGDARAVCEFMERVAGRACTPIEKDLVMKWAVCNCEFFSQALLRRTWATFPATPALAIEADPGEMDDCKDDADNEEWWKYMKKWNRRHRQGKISKEALGDAFRAWESRKRK